MKESEFLIDGKLTQTQLGDVPAHRVLATQPTRFFRRIGWHDGSTSHGGAAPGAHSRLLGRPSPVPVVGK